MKISKDEAKILATALQPEKYGFIEMIAESKEDACAKIKVLISLQDKLEIFSNDARRQGRTSQNSFSDVLKRYCK